jgi:hypothetical protein
VFVSGQLGLDLGELRVQTFAVRLDPDGRLLIVGRIPILPALK